MGTCQGGSNNLYLKQKYENIRFFLSENLNRHVFVMVLYFRKIPASGYFAIAAAVVNWFWVECLQSR